MKRKNFLKSLFGIPIATKAIINANAKEFHEHIPIPSGKEIMKNAPDEYKVGEVLAKAADPEKYLSHYYIYSTST